MAYAPGQYTRNALNRTLRGGSQDGPFGDLGGRPYHLITTLEHRNPVITTAVYCPVTGCSVTEIQSGKHLIVNPDLQPPLTDKELYRIVADCFAAENYMQQRIDGESHIGGPGQGVS